MGYEKQTWANGDVITADKLNHMEDGIENAGGELEYIKIGDWNGGRSNVADNVYAFNGGGTVDNSNLYGCIGDKKLFGFVYLGFDADGNTTPVMAAIELGSSGTAKDPRLYTVEERKTLVGGNIFAISKGLINRIRIFAVCE